MSKTRKVTFWVAAALIITAVIFIGYSQQPNCIVESSSAEMNKHTCEDRIYYTQKTPEEMAK